MYANTIRREFIRRVIMIDNVKTELCNLALAVIPSETLIFNIGLSEIHGKMYNYILSSKNQDGMRVAYPLHFNAPKISEGKSYKNFFLFSGILTQYSVHKGRTYVTLRQDYVNKRAKSDYTIVRLVLSDVLNLDDRLDSHCLVAGYLFPKPLGSRDVAIGGCCEILKFTDETVYNVNSESL